MKLREDSKQFVPKKSYFGNAKPYQSIEIRQTDIQLKQQKRKMDMIRDGILSTNNRQSHIFWTQTFDWLIVVN